jgi:hypothetical protein
MALHPWHLLLDEEGRALPERESGDVSGDAEALLAGLAALDGVEFSTPSAYLESRPGSVREAAGTGGQPPGSHL